jgi:hypothetical protein
MADDQADAHAQQEPPRPNPDLENLDRLVGKWNVTGGDSASGAWVYPGGGYDSTMTRVR